jgi:hypothetical protein
VGSLLISAPHSSFQKRVREEVCNQSQSLPSNPQTIIILASARRVLVVSSFYECRSGTSIETKRSTSQIPELTFRSSRRIREPSIEPMPNLRNLAVEK